MPKLFIEKSVTIEAPVNQVYPLVRDFKQWPIWSPWLTAEPDCPLQYSEDGKSYNWDGKIIGAGSNTIVSETENQQIELDLQFFKPWKSQSKVTFDFSEQDGSTTVIWRMFGSLPIFMFWMKNQMEAWVGMDYQRGLAMLKDLAETGEVPSKTEFPGEETFEGFSYIGIRRTCDISNIQIMEEDFGKLMAYIQEKSLSTSPRSICQYHKWDLVKGTAVYTAAMAVDSIPEDLSGEFISGVFPTCRTYTIKHTGPYRHLSNPWSAGMMRSQAKVYKTNKKIDPFEYYINNPETTPENELETVVHFPVK